jgi:protein-S-isoprenylcysteine O-methyltransferase Ste14
MDRMAGRDQETRMKIVKTIAGVVLLLLGALWTLQGANIVGGSVMSGQSQWLYIGIVVALAGLALLYWTHLRRRI